MRITIHRRKDADSVEVEETTSLYLDHKLKTPEQIDKVVKHFTEQFAKELKIRLTAAVEYTNRTEGEPRQKPDDPWYY